ncbi:MAG: hypothetical protein IPP94_07445 [Ignavibacteria bacterium]|nr:hypothetical protein [Ignavibacteria bacterium]
MRNCMVVVLIVLASVPAIAQDAEVRRIRSYRMELEETLGGGEEGGDAGTGTVRMTRVLPGSGPQETVIAFRSVDLEGDDKPWERRTVLLTAVITSNMAARASRREYCFRAGALVLCTVHEDTASADREEHFFSGTKTIGSFLVRGNEARALPAGTSLKRSSQLREAGERLGTAFRALVRARADMDREF